MSADRRRGRSPTVLSGITGALLVAVVLLGACTGWAWWAARQNQQAVRRIRTDDVPLAMAANNLRTEVAGMLQGQALYVLYQGEGRAEFEAKLEKVDGAVDALRSLVDSPRQLALLDKMRSEISAFRAVDTHIWTALQEGRTDAARSLTLGPNTLTASFVNDDADELARQTRELRDAALLAADHRLRTDTNLALGFGIGTVVAMSALGLLAHRRLRLRLRDLDVATRRALDGEQTAIGDEDLDDELARVGGAVNELVARWRAAQGRIDLDRTLRRGFDRVTNETEALAMVADSLRELMPGTSVELLLVDELEPTVAPAVVHGNLPGGPSCPVTTLGGCAATREGQTLRFASPAELGACPKLVGRQYGPVAAACVPVSFLGRPLGVLHTIATEGSPPDAVVVEQLEAIGTHAGHAIGEARAEAQAAIDLDLDV